MSKRMTDSITSALSRAVSNLQLVKQSKKNKKGKKGLTIKSRIPRGILAGYGSPVTASFYQSRMKDGEIVHGFDLITSPLSAIHNISYFITCNPASWNGTRIAAIASGYQNYRPIQFKIHYRPQVGSTSEVSMFIGTIWQNTYITSRSSIEPSLVTSPGGTYLPAWQSSCSVVPLGGRLPMRMFPVRDPDFTTVPFSVVCRASNGGPSDVAIAMPGRIFIEYTYEFHNAIGSGGTGFQPAQVATSTVANSQIYLGSNTTAITRAIRTGGTDNGWLIDLDTEPSVRLPLFAKVTYDQITASSTAGGATSIAGTLKINGAIMGEIPSSPVNLQLYKDDGDPA